MLKKQVYWKYRKVHFYLGKVRGEEKPTPNHKPGSRAVPHLSCLLPLTQWGPPRGSDLAPNNVYLQIPDTYRIRTVLWEKKKKNSQAFLNGF